MIADPPFLRSPPFPWVDAASAAVSRPGRSRVGDPDALLAAMRSGRVGGAFWSLRDDPWRDNAAADGESTLVRATDAHGPSADIALVVAAVEAAEYRDPFTGEPIDPLAAIAILAEWRRMIDANRGVAAAVGMAAWKRSAMTQFLWNGETSAPFLDADDAIERAQASGGAIGYWPSRVGDDFRARAAAAGVTTWQIEDGFVRSAGLGVECHPPMSIIVDPTGGMHFDPSAPSIVETILATHDFDDALLARAAQLRKQIVTARVGKYGVDRGVAPAGLPTDRRIVVAIGQVADDLSVLHGGGGGIDGFLARVRAEEPDAHIVYRPHPDVVAGLRRGASDGLSSVDQVETGGSLLALIERADAVHVLSSLTGFEALLRGTPVVVHGMPFYAGWGLTRDLLPTPARRGRAVSLDALVAGALILAPRYRDPVTGLPCPPEVLVERLASGVSSPTTMLTGFRRALGRSLALAQRSA
jgi:capsular polysaccharide export protein